MVFLRNASVFRINTVEMVREFIGRARKRNTILEVSGLNYISVVQYCHLR